MGIGRIAAALLVVFMVGCQNAPAASTSPSAGPSSSPPGPDPSTSSQALIAADLEAGTIDEGTSYEYRAWALFGDARLPEKYDGSGSIGEDNALFDQIASSLDSLPDDQAAELERYLRRPTDPTSPWSSQAATGIRLAAFQADEEDDEFQLCSDPRQWFSEDWSPNGSADLGFRVWACGPTKAIVQDDLNKVIAVGSRLWPGMTYDEPDGMGLPVPDTTATASDGNGKVDVYLLEPLAECRPRGEACQNIPGLGVAAAAKSNPRNCAVTGFPEKGCSGYMLLGRGRLGSPAFESDFAHEFFHVLQMSHNGVVDLTWYHEASAVWSEWFFERDSGKPGAYGHYRAYQAESRSMLWYEYNTTIPYRPWAWPLYQETEEGPSNVFETWVAIEGATLKSELDAAVNSKLDFAAEFRNFAVQNAQPAAYFYGTSTGLDAERWQKKPDLGDFPLDPHALTNARSTLSLGVSEYPAQVDTLAAQYDEYEVIGEQIRQVEIDISELTNAGTADLDVLAQIRSSSGDNWTRFEGRGGKVKLCRDNDAEDVDTVLAVVISNHAYGRTGDRPDSGQRVKGNYKIESKDKCDERELHIGGTITWEATATDEFGDPPRMDTVSGRMDVIIHVVTPYLLLAEREDHSTYSYDYTTNLELCPSSHEEGTLESQAGVGTTDEWDYSIGTLNPGGPLGEDMHLQIILSDYCGPSMQGDVEPGSFYIQGFPDCEEGGDELFARFDGVENYVIDCDVVGFSNANEFTGTVTGHVSGVLRPLDGPHPTPPYR